MKGKGVRDISDRWEKKREYGEYGKLLKCACGKSTYQKDGVCVICKLDLGKEAYGK